MRLQMEMAEKLADGFSPHAAFEAKHKQSGHDQADEPVSACLGFPQRRLRIAVAAVHRLEVTMHTAFGKSGVLRKASDALLPVFTNRVENDQALGPQSHSGGPCSEGWLTWCLKSALQSTRSTTHCPALETWPLKVIKFPTEGGWILRPQGFQDLDILVAHRPTTRKVRRVQGCKLLAQPTHPDANSYPPTRQHIDGAQHFRGEHRIAIRQNHDAGDQTQ